MSTTRTPIIVREFPAIADNPDAMGQLRDGLANALALTPTDLEGSEGRAGWAWDRMLDEVIAEQAPMIADQLTEAIVRRLPWTWEPER